jgi:DNA repair protein SbcC/Rad50
VALAVGRFAAGKSRPLGSVIIDEGFGGLDRDGLRAAAEELNRLRGQLRRILLVSHQEEFATNFPAGYWLCRGESGTTAERFRR